MMVIVYFYSRS